MAYMDSGKPDSGKLAVIGPNTKGTGTRGVPVAIASMSRDRTAAAVEDPEKKQSPNAGGVQTGNAASGSASGQDGIRDLGRKRMTMPDPKPRPNPGVAPKS